MPKLVYKDMTYTEQIEGEEFEVEVSYYISYHH